MSYVKDLEAIEGRADAATPGPWGPSRLKYCEGFVCADPEKPPLFTPCVSNFKNKEADAAFIRGSRTDVPRLVRFARKLMSEGETVAEQLAGPGTRPMIRETWEHLWKEVAKCPK